MRFDDYKDKYANLAMRRRDGILEVRLHSDGGPLEWGPGAIHRDFADAFADIGRDDGNRIVIITGTGDRFSGPPGDPATFPVSTAETWEDVRRHGVLLFKSLIELEAIVISCVNGPALRHPEIPLLADIVLAAPSATFQDSGHLRNRLMPGDGVHIVFPLLLGHNRGRHFLLTGRELGAREAQELGLVAELLPAERLLERAWELADELARQNPLALRYTRLMLMEPLKRMAQDLLGYGLALEGLGAVDESTRWEREKKSDTNA